MPNEMHGGDSDSRKDGRSMPNEIEETIKKMGGNSASIATFHEAEAMRASTATFKLEA